MIVALIQNQMPVLAFLGILFAFVATCLITTKCIDLLPKDQGREFAVNGKLSAGKPRGAGIIFVLVFAASSLIFVRFSVEYTIYIALVVAEMFTGFFDDAAEKPWGELKKGILDLLIAIAAAITFIHFNSTTVIIACVGMKLAIPPVVFAILTVVLVWASINVTNCSDGVDGLSGTLTIITLVTIYVIRDIVGLTDDFSLLILIFVVCILGYLWYNATPSRLLMGDAGSRAMGIFISIAILKTNRPFLYLLVAFVLLVDGGLGLIKVALLRYLKIHILKNTKTPLHDHVRKNLGWSNTQTVFRFCIIQIVLAIAVCYMLIL